MKKKLYIILSIFLFSIIVSFVDAVIKPDYFIKILVKIFFFLFIPILYFIIHKDEVDVAELEFMEDLIKFRKEKGLELPF